MQRKVNQIGPSTLMVSLPSKWAKKYNVRKGDVIEVEEQRADLVLHNPGKQKEPLNLVIDLEDLNQSLIWYYIIAAYRSGAEEIHLQFSQQKVRDDKNNQEVDIHKLLQSMVNQCIGMEIVRNTPSQYILKEISSIKQDEFATIFRRIFFSLSVMFDDLLDGAEKKNQEIITHVAQYADIQINKFTDYCLRILAKTNNETPLLNNIILKLEEIGDSLKHLALHISQRQLTIDLIDILKENKVLFSLMEKFYFTSTKKNLIALEEQKILLTKRREKIPKSTDLGALIILRRIKAQILSLLETKLVMTLAQNADTNSSSLREGS